MGYHEDLPSTLVGGVVLRDKASVAKGLTEPNRTESYVIELADFAFPPRTRSVIDRLLDLVTLR